MDAARCSSRGPHSEGSGDGADPGAAELQVTATLWQRLRAAVPEAEVAEVYQRLGPEEVDNNELLLAELQSLVDILGSYRKEADGVARQRAEAARLCRQPQQELLRLRLQQLLQESGGAVDEDTIRYATGAAPPTRPPSSSSRPSSTSSFVVHTGGQHRSWRCGSSGVASSIDSRPTSLASPAAAAPAAEQPPDQRGAPAAAAARGGVDFSLILPAISLRSVDAQRRFDAVLPELRELLARERALLEEDVGWVHELLRDEMRYMSRAKSFTEPTLSELSDACARVKHQADSLRMMSPARGPVCEPLSPPSSAGSQPRQSSPPPLPLAGCTPPRRPLPAAGSASRPSPPPAAPHCDPYRRFGCGSPAPEAEHRGAAAPAAPAENRGAAAAPGGRRSRVAAAKRYAADADAEEQVAEEARQWLSAAAAGSPPPQQLPRRGCTVDERFDLGIDLSDDTSD